MFWKKDLESIRRYEKEMEGVGMFYTLKNCSVFLEVLRKYSNWIEMLPKMFFKKERKWFFLILNYSKTFYTVLNCSTRFKRKVRRILEGKEQKKKSKEDGRMVEKVHSIENR